MTTATVELPPKLIPVFAGDAWVRGAYGGRGSGKTMSFARMLAVRAYMFASAGVSGVMLGCREYMNSLDDSSFAEIRSAIASTDWLAPHFEVGRQFIRTRDDRVHFRFAGLRHNLASVKSKARLLIAWADEAEQISDAGWETLEPTLRDERSELWVTWNPGKEGSATDRRFRKAPPPRSKIVELNWSDNPWFPEVLRRQKDDMLARNPQRYNHVWGGGYDTRSEALVFRNWRAVEFETPPDARFYHGADWGFAADPTVLVRCFVDDRTLYVDREVSAIGCEIDDLPALFGGEDRRREARWENRFGRAGIDTAQTWPIIADSARPETISYMRRKGFDIRPAAKGRDSVKEGVEWLCGMDIVVHPRCTRTVRELSSYQWKVDRLTGEILPVLEDADNHCIDALRYALEPYRRGAARRSIYEAVA